MRGHSSPRHSARRRTMRIPLQCAYAHYAPKFTVRLRAQYRPRWFTMLCAYAHSAPLIVRVGALIVTKVAVYSVPTRTHIIYQ